jgi:hypothetical protein
MSRDKYDSQRSLRERLEAAGCPVDKKEAQFDSPGLSIEPFGGVAETRVFDTKYGGMDCMLDILITNRGRRSITIYEFDLRLPWDVQDLYWLDDPYDASRSRGQYRMLNGLEYPRDLVLNHQTYDLGTIRPGEFKEGFLLGHAGTPVPDYVRGGLIDAEISVLDQFLARHSAKIQLWADRSERREARPSRKGEGLYAPYERERHAAEDSSVAAAGEAAGDHVNVVNFEEVNTIPRAQELRPGGKRSG